MRTFLTSWARLSAFCRSMGTMDIGTVQGAAAAEGETTTLEGSMMYDVSRGLQHVLGGRLLAAEGGIIGSKGGVAR